MNKLLIATHNAGKAQELQRMLLDSPIDVVSLDRFRDIPAVEEIGATFTENARLKAAAYAQATGLIALADDSGLEISALGGRPGVLSARYGGEATSFPEKMRMLLAEMGRSGSMDRSARFVCAMALASPDGLIVAATEGLCAGHITGVARGIGGFGYDPIFVPVGFAKTFGELPSAIKDEISHRALAFSHIMPILRDYYDTLT